MSEPEYPSVGLKGLRARLKNRRVFVGRNTDGTLYLHFTRLKSGKPHHTALVLTDEAMRAVIHLYFSLAPEPLA